VAKCGDRPRELGDYALKQKKKHHEHFIRPPVTPYARPNYAWLRINKALGIIRKLITKTRVEGEQPSYRLGTRPSPKTVL